MSKKVCQQHKPKQPGRNSRSRRKAVVVMILVLSVSVASVILAQWRNVRRASNLSPIPQISPTPQLTKEYIYAGGKLIATEEPGNSGSSPLPAPSGLSATGFSLPNRYVNLSWTASAGTDVDHYQVERCSNITVTPTCYMVVATNVPASGSTVNFTDTITGSTEVIISYLYRVRGANASNTLFSAYSQPDLATAITFMDDSLVSGVTEIKAQHLVELRHAVNAVRALAGLTTASWTYPDPVSGQPQQRRSIYLEDVTDLRTKLDDALTLLGRSQPYDADPPLGRGSPIRAAHFTQIRNRVR